MEDGFNWWSALETFLAVGAGAIASFLSITVLEKRKRSSLIDMEEERFLIELKMLKETLIKDYFNIIECVDEMNLESGLIITPGFSEFDFRALEGAFYHASIRLNATQREHYSRMLTDAKYVKSERSRAVIQGVEENTNEFAKEASKIRSELSDLKVSISLIVARIGAVLKNESKVVGLEARLKNMDKEIRLLKDESNDGP